MNLRARIGLALLAVSVAAGLTYGFLPRPIPVEVATASRGPLRVTVEEEGKTRVRERYVIAAPMAGQLRRIILKAGDAVTAGETLAVIEPAPAAVLDPRSRAQAAARLAAAQAALAAAEENVRAARAETALAR
ncbi:MAG: efflux transporter periplasmic adaptor subunit, partial [Burkholderiales bacterium]